jgi:hypothetical protein
MNNSRRIMTIAATLSVALSWSANALACRYSPPPPSDEQLGLAQADVIAFKAIVTKLSPLGEMKGIPHEGFTLDLKVIKVFNGDVAPTVSVFYGPCHFVNGQVGETINVLARKMPDGVLASY